MTRRKLPDPPRNPRLWEGGRPELPSAANPKLLFSLSPPRSHIILLIEEVMIIAIAVGIVVAFWLRLGLL